MLSECEFPFDEAETTRCAESRLHLLRSVHTLPESDIYLLSWIAESFAARRKRTDDTDEPAPDEPARADPPSDAG